MGRIPFLLEDTMSKENNLFDYQVQAAAEKLAVEMIEDKDYLLKQVHILLSEKALIEKELSDKDEIIQKQLPLVKKYEYFLDSDGYVSAAELSDILQINYLTPKGKARRAGSHYVLQILKQDGYVIKSVNGYRVPARYEHLGRSIMAQKNDRNYAVAQFNAEGVDYLATKYLNDTRIWRGTHGKQIICEVELSRISEQSEKSHLSLEESHG